MTENVKKVSKVLTFPSGVPPMRISLHEIARNIVDSQEILGWESIDNSALSFLWKSGMDIDKDIGLDVCNIRDSVLAASRTQIVLVGFERTDNEWTQLRKSSLQATIGRNDDKFLRVDLYNAACIPMIQAESTDIGENDPDTTINDYTYAEEQRCEVFKVKRKEFGEMLKVLYNIDLVEIE